MVTPYRTQRYCACQLIAAINARIYLGRQDVSDQEFERLVDLTLCRRGAALHIDLALPILGLERIEGDFSLEWIANHLPVAVSTHEIEHHGLHLVLIVGVVGEVLELVNFYRPHVTWDELQNIQPPPHLKKCFSYKLT